MSIEKDYYENEDFWKSENIGEYDKKRIVEISKLIPKDVISILDVGCGNGLFLNYLKYNSYDCLRLLGVDRSKIALKYVNTLKIRSGINFLPFKNDKFDLVSSLEVIEHLPNGIYKEGLYELCRVSKKYVMISVPNNQLLENSLVKCEQCKTRFNPDYHIRSFNKNAMENLLTNFGFNCKSINWIGEQEIYLLATWIIELLAARNNKGNPFMTEIPCPVCGYLLEPRKDCTKGANRSDSNRKNKWYNYALKKMWPKNMKYKWIVGIYEKA